VEQLLASTEQHLSRLRRASPYSSLPDAVQQLTKKFVLCLPYPRPGEWLRGMRPVRKTYLTDDDVEARSVEELLPCPNPVEAIRIKRVYMSQAATGSRAKHEAALRIVHEMRHPDEPEENFDPQRQRQRGKGDTMMAHGDEEASGLEALYSRAGHVSKEVMRYPDNIS